MARPVRLRTSYTGDRSRLARLEEAIERDPRLGETPKSELLELLRRLSVKLLEVDTTTPPQGGKKRK